MLEIFKTQLIYNIFFIHFSYMKIPHILHVAYYKLNGVHHCFIMKVLKNLNRFFHVYAINVNVTTCVTTFLAYFTMLLAWILLELLVTKLFVFGNNVIEKIYNMTFMFKMIITLLSLVPTKWSSFHPPSV
jgi:hypothetical protein